MLPSSLHISFLMHRKENDGGHFGWIVIKMSVDLFTMTWSRGGCCRVAFAQVVVSITRVISFRCFCNCAPAPHRLGNIGLIINGILCPSICRSIAHRFTDCIYSDYCMKISKSLHRWSSQSLGQLASSAFVTVPLPPSLLVTFALA